MKKKRNHQILFQRRFFIFLTSLSVNCMVHPKNPLTVTTIDSREKI